MRFLSCASAAWLKARSHLLLLITCPRHRHRSRGQRSSLQFRPDFSQFSGLSAAASRMTFLPAVILEDCHRSSVCSFLHDNIGLDASVISKLTRISLPSPAVNWIPQRCSGSPSTLSNDSVCAGFTTSMLVAILLGQVETTEPESIFGRLSASCCGQHGIACACRGWWISKYRWQTLVSLLLLLLLWTGEPLPFLFLSLSLDHCPLLWVHSRISRWESCSLALDVFTYSTTVLLCGHISNNYLL